MYSTGGNWIWKTTNIYKIRQARRGTYVLVSVVTITITKTLFSQL